MDKPRRDKTAFKSHHGLNHFKHMSFGFRNASSSFQLTIDVILFAILWKFFTPYIYYVASFLHSPTEDVFRVRRVLTLLKNPEMTLHVEKCRIVIEIIDYLGQIIWSRFFEIASQSTEAIRGIKALTNLKEFYLFLALWNFFRRFLLNFASMTAFINKSLRKGYQSTFRTPTEEELQCVR